jgi:hypothetical protein
MMPLVAAFVYLLLPGVSAFEYTHGCSFFEYFSKPENADQEENFNSLMTTLTTTMDSAAKLYVSYLDQLHSANMHYINMHDMSALRWRITSMSAVAPSGTCVPGTWAMCALCEGPASPAPIMSSLC